MHTVPQSLCFVEYLAGDPDKTLFLAERPSLEALTLQEGDGAILNFAIDCTESAPNFILCRAESHDESVCLTGAKCLLLISFLTVVKHWQAPRVQGSSGLCQAEMLDRTRSRKIQPAMEDSR